MQAIKLMIKYMEIDKVNLQVFYVSNQDHLLLPQF